MRKRGSALIALVGTLCIAAAATTIVPMSVEQLTRASTDVVQARAVDSRAAWNADRTMIYTYTRFTVARTLKGSAPNVITVKQMGGRADGYTQKVSGVRHWTPGDEAVLFLKPSAAKDGTMVVTGLIQGNFRLARDSSGAVTVSNGAPEVSRFEAATRTATEYRGAKMTLETLQQRVRKAQER